MIRFNAPIPSYADLNFLFHRWGYDALGENGRAVFRNSIIYHFYEDGLNLSLCYNDHDLAYIPPSKPYPEIFGEYDCESKGFSWLDQATLEKQGVQLFEGFEEHLKITDMEIFENGTVRIHEVDHQGKALKFLDSKISDGDNSVRIFRPVSEECPYDMIQVKRDDLKMFEQQIGYLNHGVPAKELEQFFATVGKSKKRQINSGLKRINEQRKLSLEQIQETAKVYLEMQENHPSYGKTALLDLTGEKLGVTGVTVKKRLSKLNFFANFPTT